MNVVVTGGAGFIGSHLTERLVGDGHRVTVIDNLCTGRRENLAAVAGEIRFVEGDLRDPALLRDALRGAEVVYHQAALPSVARSIADPLESHEVNVTGTLNVLQAARKLGVRRVIYAGSSSVYGDTPTLPKREDMPVNPRSPYAVSKLAGEMYCRAFHRVYGLETVVLRYFNVFGPRQDPQSQYASVIPRFIHLIRHGEAPTVYGDGNQTRDFTYIDNAVEANVLAAHQPLAAEPFYNVGCDRQTSINELISLLHTALRSVVPPQYLPPRAGDVRDSLADISRARDELGYRPLISVDEGVRLTVASFIAQQSKAGEG